MSRWNIARKTLLPLRLVVNPKMTVCLETPQDKYLEETADILKKSSDTGDGLSVDEFDRWPSVADFIKAQFSWAVINENTGETLGVVICRDSPLCRSLNPKYNAGYVALKKESRSMGLGKALFDNHWSISHSIGYVGMLGRTMASSHSIMPLKRVGVRSPAVIPNSLNQLGIGWVDDIVLQTRYTDEALEAPEPDLPKIDESIIPKPEESSRQFSTHNFPSLKLRQSTNELKMSMASSSDILQVEKMIRQAACDGNGFCLDEFSPSGFFRPKLLWDKNILVGKSHNSDEVVAAIVFGPSAICRSPGTPQVGGYIVVSKQHQNQGIGSALMDYFINQAQVLKYKGVLMDVLSTNTKAIRMALDSGFIITGTLPDCGYVKGHGFTDSIILYRSFSDAFEWSASVRLGMSI